ncbi:helix-turn-helix domain-containing protein [Catenulispora sp. NF23]|uniref:Helix-turn-helix domain-containing protein n=1 Tax=Catenulispora pinistramenti TaxID=2705254 RepID=A0ABS5KT87_9ACTN|nr:helix-turn-helix domain-containing protein [Catenulispora pinistramenti]MBS2534188.1 helix-turn-helix domain-containing protein [Catenulispora pinistramenti]MBS2549266.1 helix-turn-helix domain-containing protein [Catenulispora pinistramenti]
MASTCSPRQSDSPPRSDSLPHSGPPRHRVVVLALDGVIPFDLGIPARLFGAARDQDGQPLYDVVTCGLSAGPVATTEDYRLYVEHGAEALATADTVIVPPAYPIVDEIADGAALSPELAAALAGIRPEARKVALCTGAYVFAAAGLLDGRMVTTHWNQAEHMEEQFPALSVDPNVLFIDDGDILTSAGVAAAIDLCLHLIRTDHGSSVANFAARACVVPPSRDGGQAQYIERPMPAPTAAGTGPARAWALERLHEPLTLQDLAGQARMSIRTFTRQFRTETGQSPGQWLTRQRVDLARHLLEATDLPIDRVAERAGFGTATSMRQHLRASVGVSPQAYRRTFARV